jgi:hypothetical protein
MKSEEIFEWGPTANSGINIIQLSDRQSDRAYWLSRPAEERIAALELARRNCYGEAELNRRIQRILEITEFLPR